MSNRVNIFEKQEQKQLITVVEFTDNNWREIFTICQWQVILYLKWQTQAFQHLR